MRCLPRYSIIRRLADRTTSWCVCMPSRAQAMEEASVPCRPVVHMVDSASTAEAEDLFNNMHRIIITNLDDNDDGDGESEGGGGMWEEISICLLYTSPSPRDPVSSRMPSSA